MIVADSVPANIDSRVIFRLEGEIHLFLIVRIPFTFKSELNTTRDAGFLGT